MKKYKCIGIDWDCLFKFLASLFRYWSVLIFAPPTHYNLPDMIALETEVCENITDKDIEL